MRHVSRTFFVSLNLLLMTLVIQAQEEQQDFYVRASVTNETPFVRERILYSFQFLSYVPASNVSEQLPAFGGFWVGDIYSPSGSQVEIINGRQYVISEILVELSPLREGQIIIDPTHLQISGSVFRESVSLVTEPLTIEVLALPPGAPDAFNGGVGQFNAQIAYDKSTLTLGEPLTLTITVDGTGNLEQLPAPRLPALADWRVYPTPARYLVNSIGGLRFGQKIFEWLLVPERSGSRVIPQIDFVSFDPQIKQYATINFLPFTVEVFPGEGNASELLAFNETDQERIPITLKSIRARLSPQNSGVSAASLILWSIAPIITLVSVTILLGSHIYRTRRTRIQVSAASGKAVARLKRAATLSASQASAEAVSAAKDYFAHKQGLDVQPLNTQEIANLLSAHQIRPAVIEQLVELVNEVEGIQYIPNKTQADIRPSIQRLAAILLEIDKAW